MESWVGPRTGLEAVVKRKKIHHCPLPGTDLGRPARSLVNILTDLPAMDTGVIPRRIRVVVA